MMLAALGGHLDVVKQLRAKGAQLDYSGWTPLIYAATGGHDDVVRYLLAEGRTHRRDVAQRHDGADDGGARRQASARPSC